jgi:hypothetical protein
MQLWTWAFVLGTGNLMTIDFIVLTMSQAPL